MLGAFGGGGEALARATLHSLERRQLQLPPRRAGFARQRQVLRGVLQTRVGDFLVELSYTRGVQLIVSLSSLHAIPHKRGFLRSVGDRLNNPPISGAVFHYSASDAFAKQCWSAKGLGCRTEWGQLLTVDLCVSLVSLGNNNFGPRVKDKCFFF